MPNWCSNKTVFRHPSVGKLIRLQEAAEEGKLLEFLRPFPDGKWDYQWAINNWGTKWDVEANYIQEDFENKQIVIHFESAWAPPIDAYRWAEQELGFEIDAYFYEPGCCLLGEYYNGQDHYWDTPSSWREAKRLLDKLPDDMIDSMNLEEDWKSIFEGE